MIVYISTLSKNIDIVIFENININIDKKVSRNINIDKNFLRNIYIDKEVLQNIDIDIDMIRFQYRVKYQFYGVRMSKIEFKPDFWNRQMLSFSNMYDTMGSKMDGLAVREHFL